GVGHAEDTGGSDSLQRRSASIEGLQHGSGTTTGKDPRVTTKLGTRNRLRGDVHPIEPKRRMIVDNLSPHRSVCRLIRHIAFTTFAEDGGDVTFAGLSIPSKQQQRRSSVS